MFARDKWNRGSSRVFGGVGSRRRSESLGRKRDIIRPREPNARPPQRILVVEDQFLVALDIATLSRAGAMRQWALRQPLERHWP